MFIAHLPAGYILTRWLQRIFGTKKYLWIGFVASVFPDIDMLYFYFIDDRQTLHHHYWTHLPLFWLSIGATFFTLGFLFKNRVTLVLTTIVLANVMLHFVLDSVVGGINWLYPLIDHDLFLVTVPATHSFWIWSFVFHWTFLPELVITASAIVLWYNGRKNARNIV